MSTIRRLSILPFIYRNPILYGTQSYIPFCSYDTLLHAAEPHGSTNPGLPQMSLPTNLFAFRIFSISYSYHILLFLPWIASTSLGAHIHHLTTIFLSHFVPRTSNHVKRCIPNSQQAWIFSLICLHSFRYHSQGINHVVETWLNNSVWDGSAKLVDHHIFRHDRALGCRGGTCIFIKLSYFTSFAHNAFWSSKIA